MGQFIISEKDQDRYYIGKKEKVNSDDVTILQKFDGRLKKGDKKEQLKFVAFIDTLENFDPKLPESYNFVKKTISIKSFIDYILIETFFGNKDWLHNNTNLV